MRRLAFLPALLIAAVVGPANAAELELKPGDRICLLGNALGERMQHHNYWETLLYQRFPAHRLVVRNLCFPADEPFTRLRSLNFGSPDEHLAHSKASVVVFFFGFNESFRGREGLQAFTADLKELIEHTKAQNYSGGPTGLRSGRCPSPPCEGGAGGVGNDSVRLSDPLSSPFARGTNPQQRSL